MNESSLKRRWFRFSLRALLLLVAIAALALGWIGSARHQRRLAAEAFKSNPSAIVSYDYQLTDDGQLDRTHAPPASKWVRNLLGMDYLSNVAGADLNYPTDVDLKHLARLPNLRRLYLARAVDVTDAGLKHLLALKQLKLLVLDDADQITDAGLRTLGQLKSLAILELDRGRRMTPAGIEQLKRDLPNCRIEIRGVEQVDVLAML